MADGGAASNARKAVDAALAGLIKLNIKVAADLSASTDASVVSMQRRLLVSGALGALFALSFGFLISRSITRPLSRGVAMMQEMGKGHLGTRLRLRRRDEIGVLGDAMDQFAEDLQSIVVGTMRKVAAGDLTTEVVPKDAQDEIAPALKATIEALRGLVAEAERLTQAAVEGRLATRADSLRFEGAYRAIVEGVNATLDAVIGPLNLAAEYVDRISKGDIPPMITDNYQGDFNEIKLNLNTCIAAVRALVADANLLVEAAVAGRLATRADASKHQGDFRKIVDGVNRTLDAVIGPLNVAAE